MKALLKASWVASKVYAPGEVAEGRMKFTPQIRGGGDVSDGPWYAFIRPEHIGTQGPPELIEEAERVGEVQLTKKGNELYLARVKFAVPQLSPGGYELVFCNNPCTKSLDGFAFAFLKVVATPLESRLVNGLDRSRSQLKEQIQDLNDRAGKKIRSLRVRITSLEEETAELQSDSSESGPSSRNDSVISPYLWLGGLGRGEARIVTSTTRVGRLGVQ